MNLPPPYTPFDRESVYADNSVVMPGILSRVLRKTYGWMTMCLLITALTAYGLVRTSLFYQIFGGSALPMILLVIAQLVFVGILSARLHRLSIFLATGLLVGYSLLNGVTLSVIFAVYPIGAISTAFFVTAGMFAAISIYGLTTQRDLSKMGSFLLMALVGVIVATLVNLFLRSPMMDWVLSIIGVVLFTGLTAYDVNKIKQMVLESPIQDRVDMDRMAIRGALALYLDFVNLFLYILRLFSRR